VEKLIGPTSPLVFFCPKPFFAREVKGKRSIFVAIEDVLKINGHVTMI